MRSFLFWAGLSFIVFASMFNENHLVSNTQAVFTGLGILLGVAGAVSDLEDSIARKEP